MVHTTAIAVPNSEAIRASNQTWKTFSSWPGFGTGMPLVRSRVMQRPLMPSSSHLRAIEVTGGQPDRPAIHDSISPTKADWRRKRCRLGRTSSCRRHYDTRITAVHDMGSAGLCARIPANGRRRTGLAANIPSRPRTAWVDAGGSTVVTRMAGNGSALSARTAAPIEKMQPLATGSVGPGSPAKESVNE